MAWWLLLWVTFSSATVTAYAAREGHSARESVDLGVRNGYFTEALLANIKTHGHSVPFVDLLDNVYKDVQLRTGNLQKPDRAGSVPTTVFLVDVYGGRPLPGPNPGRVTVRTIVESLHRGLQSQVRATASSLLYTDLCWTMVSCAVFCSDAMWYVFLPYCSVDGSGLAVTEWFDHGFDLLGNVCGHFCA